MRRNYDAFQKDRRRRNITMLEGFTQLFNNLYLFGGDLFHLGIELAA